VKLLLLLFALMAAIAFATFWVSRHPAW